MNLYEQEIAILKKFIEKVDYLNSLSFVRTLSEGNSQLTISWTRDTGILTLAQRGPNSEQIDAFVLSMRLFMQNNDSISIWNTSQLIQTLPFPHNLKQEFADLRENLNDYLDSDSRISILEDNPTNREILETILYGRLAHVQPEKQARCERWFAAPMMEQVVSHKFIGILLDFLRGIRGFASIIQEGLLEVESKPGETNE